MTPSISPLPPTQGEERAREVLAAIRTKHAESAVMYSGEDSVIAAMLAFAAERTVSTPVQREVDEALLDELAIYLPSIRVFLMSKERPHEAGVKWHEELIAKINAVRGVRHV